jgi:hypothetical protein
MNILTNLFGRLAAFHRHAQQQQELLLQQKRERFLSVHNSDTPPTELLAPSPRQLRRRVALPFVYISLMLLYGAVFFGITIIPAFKALDVREIEMRNWLQTRTAKPPVDKRDARNQKLTREAAELDAESTQAYRNSMVFHVVICTAFFTMYPLLLIWLHFHILSLLRNGIVTRAEFVSRKSWGGSTRVSFTTTNGTPVETVPTILAIPVYVPVGAKLWALYSSRCPKRALVYRPDSGLAKLLRNTKSCTPSAR